MTIDEAIKHCLEVAEEQSRLYSLCPCPCDGTKNCMSLKNGKDMGCTKCAADHRQLAEWLTELKEAKRLLKAAVKDFAKLDRENAKNKNCMMPEMHCADCPLNRDSVDDRAEPCHSWRYADEALKLIGGSENG